MNSPGPIHPVSPMQAPGMARPAPKTQPGHFASVFDKALRQSEEVRFSAHALQRLEERNIVLDETELDRIQEALDALAAKGARTSLLVLERVSLVMSVPNRTVITAMPSDEAGQTVFTNIDSAVVGRPTTTKQTATQGPVPDRGGPRAAERPTRHTAQEISL